MIELPFLAGERGRGPFLVVLFFISVMVITAWGIWEGTLPADEEALAAEAAKEVFETGNFLTMHFNSGALYNLPPLPAVFAAPFIKMLGTTEVAARLPFVLFSIVILFFVFVTGGAERDATTNPSDWITDRHAVGLLSGIILAASPIFAKYSPHITFNLPFTMFMTLSLMGWLLLPEKKLGMVLWAAGIAGGMLSAGIGGLFPLGAGIFSVLFDRGRRVLYKRIDFWLITLAAVAVGSVWVLPAILNSGNDISAGSLVWFGLGNFPGFSRSLGMLFKSAGKVWIGFLPWSIPATAAGIRILFWHRREEQYRDISGTDYSLLSFAIFFFVSIAVIEPSYPGGFLPVLPVVSILAAREMARWFRNLEMLWSFNQTMVGILCFLMLLLFTTPLSLHRRETDSVELVAEAKAKTIEANRAVFSFKMDINKYEKARFLFYGGWAPEGNYKEPQEIVQVVKKDPGRVFISSPVSLREFKDTELKDRIDIIYMAGDIVLFSFRCEKEIDKVR